jgi:hypothetical protein
VELATATAQLDAERAAHQREQQAATERLNDTRAQGATTLTSASTNYAAPTKPG